VHLPLKFYAAERSGGWIGHTASSAATAGRVYGLNRTELEIPSWLTLLSRQLVQPFFLFQLFCVALWMLDEYWYYALYTLFALLVLEATVAYQQWQSLQRLHTSTSQVQHRRDKVWVLRRGNDRASASAKDWILVTTTELVPGDVTCFGKQGATVPADLLLLRGTAVCDEALLTGESVPQLKRPIAVEDNNSDGNAEEERLDLQDHKESVLFAGTKALMLSGDGNDGEDSYENGGDTNGGSSIPDPPSDGVVGFVLRTSFDTAQGSLLRTMAHSSMSKSNKSMHNSWDTFCFIAILVACAILSATHVWNHARGDDSRNQLRLLLHVILIITSVVPPELPMELSLAITNSVADLIRKKKVYCTEHGCIPVAGQVQVCAFDKTGTLTSDEMRLKGVRLVHGDDTEETIRSEDLILPSLEDDYADNGGVESEEKLLPWPTLRIMAACHSLATTSYGKRQKVVGDPLEQEVLKHTGFQLVSNNVVAPYLADEDEEDVTLHICHRFAFSSKLKRMTVLVTEGTKNSSVYGLTKGAPETIRNLLKSVPACFDEIAEYHMSKGRRVLAMAYRQVGHKRQIRQYKEDRAGVEQNLIFAGFLVLDCPLKSDSKAVLNELRKSKHGIVMITGDAILTATEVARQVGIVRSAASRNVYRIQPAASPNATGQLVSAPTDDVLQTLECVPLFSSNELERDVPQLVSLSAIDRFSELAQEGKACFCMTGDVLTKIASAVLPKALHLDEKHMLLHKSTQSVLAHLVPVISVFARHTPHQKEAVIAALNRRGFYTLMCGDGTNDVGALKRASVGISIISAPQVESKQRKAAEKIHKARAEEKEDLKKDKTKNKKKSSKKRNASIEESMRQLREAQEDLDRVELGDASVAAPFTSRAVSIKCCKDVIQQGRCTLVTMLSIYKILGINCLVNALVLSKLFLHGVKQGDRQLTVLGIAVAALFYFVTRAEPLSTLSVVRPPSSVLCLQALLSISSQFVIHAGHILLATEAGLYFVDPFDPSLVPDGPFNPNVLNSCSFLLTCIATINTFAVNYRGRPFMADLRENRFLYRSLQACYAVLAICALEAFPPLNDLLQLSELPTTMDDDQRALLLENVGSGEATSSSSFVSSAVFEAIQATDFRVFLCGLMATDTALAFAAERYIVNRFEGK